MLFFQDKTLTIYCGDAREVLCELPDESVQCCVTSPPYFGLRDYGTAVWEGGSVECDHSLPRGGNGTASAKQVTSLGTQAYQFSRQCAKCGAARTDKQIGLEETPQAYVETMVEVFRELRRVLRSDGTVWLNLGDSYAGGDRLGRNDAGRNFTGGGGNRNGSGNPGKQGQHKKITECKPKDLIGIPWQVAFALRADGWYLRSEIIWHKLNPMPESVTDRPTKAHEQIFLLAKSGKYFYNAEAIKEESVYPVGSRADQKQGEFNGKRNGSGLHDSFRAIRDTRNKRSVWSVATQPFTGAHFATFPCDLIEPCILAGCPEGGTVLDPFAGSGTTLQVAEKNGCKATGIELNLDYCRLIEKRLRQQVLPMFAPEPDAQPPAQKGNE